MNHLFKDVQEHKELPLDTVVLSFLQLSIYYSNEIKKGFGNCGNYKLKPEFLRFYMDSRFADLQTQSLESDIDCSPVTRKDIIESCIGSVATFIE